jgi:hypothetical protein
MGATYWGGVGGPHPHQVGRGGRLNVSEVFTGSELGAYCFPFLKERGGVSKAKILLLLTD